MTKRINTMKVLELTHSIEKEYGTVQKCPQDDHRLLELHKLMEDPEDKRTKFKPKMVFHNEEEKQQVIELAKKGFNNREIERKVDLPYGTISYWAGLLRDKRPPMYREVLINKETGVKVYFPSKAGIKKWCALKRVLFSKLEKNTEKTYQMHSVKKHWYELPGGALYTNNSNKHYYLKTDVDSFQHIKLNFEIL